MTAGYGMNGTQPGAFLKKRLELPVSLDRCLPAGKAGQPGNGSFGDFEEPVSGQSPGAPFLSHRNQWRWKCNFGFIRSLLRHRCGRREARPSESREPCRLAGGIWLFSVGDGLRGNLGLIGHDVACTCHSEHGHLPSGPSGRMNRGLCMR